MIFLGYNFLQDRYCWQPVPTNLNNLSEVVLTNGIYDHFNITKDTNFPYITTYPSTWDLNTQMDANFDGNINAGNIGYIVSQISSIKVKRRIKGTFDWYTLYNVPINKVSDIDFVKYDYLAQNETDYEYAIVPVIGNIEGEYSINSIKSQFYGIFITDNKVSYKIKENAAYSNNERVHMTATYEPYGSKYPIVVKNGEIDYDKGSLSGDIIVLDNLYEIDRKATVEKLKSIKDFLATPSAKILKDFNGNIWLVSISENTAITYYAEAGLGFANLSFNWVEIGDSNSGEDLYDNNLIYSNN